MVGSNAYSRCNCRGLASLPAVQPPLEYFRYVIVNATSGIGIQSGPRRCYSYYEGACCSLIVTEGAETVGVTSIYSVVRCLHSPVPPSLPEPLTTAAVPVGEYSLFLTLHAKF